MGRAGPLDRARRRHGPRPRAARPAGGVVRGGRRRAPARPGRRGGARRGGLRGRRDRLPGARHGAVAAGQPAPGRGPGVRVDLRHHPAARRVRARAGAHRSTAGRRPALPRRRLRVRGGRPVHVGPGGRPRDEPEQPAAPGGRRAPAADRLHGLAAAARGRRLARPRLRRRQRRERRRRVHGRRGRRRRSPHRLLHPPERHGPVRDARHRPPALPAGHGAARVAPGGPGRDGRLRLGRVDQRQPRGARGGRRGARALGAGQPLGHRRADALRARPGAAVLRRRQHLEPGRQRQRARSPARRRVVAGLQRRARGDRP